MTVVVTKPSRESLAAIFAAIAATLPMVVAQDSSAQHLGPLPIGIVHGAQAQEYLNTADDSVMVWVPPGSFVMGDDETGKQNVTISRGFFMGKYEVTHGQYCRFLAATGELSARSPRGRDEPANRVSWSQAAAYAAWANLRLPTEAEWEYSARSTDNRAFAWGSEWVESALSETAVAIGTKPFDRSPFGCMDMGGNVQEWVSDWFAPYSDSDQVLPDPTGPASGERKVHRGGSWNNRLPSMYKAALRHHSAITARHDFVGFRICRDGER